MAFVPALLRASAILDLIAQVGPQKLSEIARHLDLPKSSTHGLCQTLCHLGLLHEADRGYAIGAKSLFWAGSFHQDSILSEVFTRIVSQDARLAPYTVTLSSLEGRDVVYSACQNSTQPLGITFRTGMRVPAVFSATGKAMLAQEANLPDLDPWPALMTPYSVKNLKSLNLQLQEIRRSGIGIDRNEMRAGMLCLGAAIPMPAASQARAAVALSMTEAECPPEKMPQMRALLLTLAQQIASAAFRP